MDRERHAWIQLSRIAADGVVVAALWVAVVLARRAMGGGELWPGLRPVSAAVHLPLLALMLPVWLGSLWSQGWYSGRRGLGQGRQLLLGVALASLVAQALLFALKLDLASRTVVYGFSAASLPALAAGRAAISAVTASLGRRWLAPHRVVLVGGAEDSAALVHALRQAPGWGLEVLGRMGDQDGAGACPWLGPAEGLGDLLLRVAVDEVIVAGPGVALGAVAARCEELGVRLTVSPWALGLRSSRPELREVFPHPLITFSRGSGSGAELAVKRAMDVVGALVLGALSLPLAAGIAVAVRVSDGGPALFRQERVGRGGRRFVMLKFRTMVQEAPALRSELERRNEVDGPAFKLTDDPRVTRIGRILRRTSADELPQLLNVLRGEMSLVGPRPPLPDEVERYQPWQLRRLSMRPGLTCIWQVSGRSDLSFERWMELDLAYIDQWSIGLDLWLLLRTLPAVIGGRGAR